MARRRDPNEFVGYEDNSALPGIGGYQPTEQSGAAYGSGIARPYPQPERQDRRLRTVLYGLLIVGAAVALVLAYLQVKPENSQARPDDPAAGWDAGLPKVTVPAAVPGWRPVVKPDSSLVYDVPPNWTPTPSILRGWETKPGLPGLHLIHSAELDRGFCQSGSKPNRGDSGIGIAATGDMQAAATQFARDIATHEYSDNGKVPTQTALGSPERVEVSLDGQGKTQAVLVLIEVAPAANSDSCLPKRAVVGALAFTTSPVESQKSAVLAVHTHQDFAGATTSGQLKQMLLSLRAVPEESRITIQPTPTG